MAAYAALVSLMRIIEKLRLHPHPPPISLNKNQIHSLTAKISFLEEFLEAYNPHLGYSAEADPLETRIADAAYAAEDVIESNIVDSITNVWPEFICSDDVYEGLKKVIQDMASIQKEAKKIRKTLGLQLHHHTNSTPHQESLRSNSMAHNSRSMVGVDDVLHQIKDELTSDDRRLQIIPIVGMGGSAYGNKHKISTYEIVCHDRTGERIHGTIRVDDYNRLKLDFSEGQLFAFRFFKVENNFMKYRTTTFAFKFTTTKLTKVQPFKDESFPFHQFVFMPYSTINDRSIFNGTNLIDVVGKVVHVSAQRTPNIQGRDSRVVDFILQDNAGMRVVCELWAELGDELLTYWQDKTKRPVIMLLQMCREKLYNDEVRITNAYHSTKMYLNADVRAINEFRLRIPKDVTPTRSTNTGSTSSKIDDEISTGNCKLLTIQSLTDEMQVGNYWVYGTIEEIQDKGVWCYISCVRCARKVFPVGEKFFCDRCNLYDTNGTFRYKLVVEISDSTGRASLLIWNREAVELIGKTAAELRTRSNDGTEDLEIPAEISSLIMRDVLFKVQVKYDNIGQEKPFHVIGINSDLDLVNKYSATISLKNSQSDGLDLLSILANCEFADEYFHDSTSNNDLVTPKSEASTKCSVDNPLVLSTVKNLEGDFDFSVKKGKDKVEVKDEMKENVTVERKENDAQFGYHVKKELGVVLVDVKKEKF